MGYIIEIEGTDGSGKETQARLLTEKLQKIGYNCGMVSFPYYTSLSSSLVRSLLSGEFGENVNPYAAALTFTMDRYFSYIKKWKDLYDEKDILIFDRYIGSNYIYQTVGMTMYDTLKMIHLFDYMERELGLPSPKRTLFLNMPVEKSDELISDRKNKITGEDEKDIYEKNNTFRHKVYNNSLRIQNLLGWDKIDCVDENNEIKSIDTIHQEIMNWMFTDKFDVSKS